MAVKMDDRGAWVVAFAAAFSSFLNGGFSHVFGVYMVAWQEHFDVEASTISAIASEFNLVSRFSGLLSGALCKRYGCQHVLFVSGVITVLSTFLGSFSTTIWHLHLLAIFSGFGFGLGLIPPFVAVGYHFDKHLGLANGMASAGTGFGVLAMAPLVEILCEQYGWQGALLIHSAINAHRIVCAQLLKPSDNEKRAILTNRRIGAEKRASVRKGSLGNRSKKKDRCNNSIRSGISHEMVHMMTNESGNGNGAEMKHGQSYAIKHVSDERREACRRTGIVKDSDEFPEEVQSMMISNTRENDANDEGNESDPKGVNKEIETNDTYCDIKMEGVTLECGPVPESSSLDNDSSKDDVVESKTISVWSHFVAVLYAVRQSFDFKLFRDPGFSIYMAIFFLTSASTISIRNFIPSRLVFDLGVPRIKATFSLTVLGAFNTVVRLFHGLLLDVRLMSLPNLFLLGMLLAGVSEMLNPLAESFASQIALVAILGIGDGLIIPLSILMLKRLASPERLPNAVGFRYGVGGIANFIGILIIAPKMIL